MTGHPERTSTWKLPNLHADGSFEERRLPEAIQAVLRDCRSEQVRLPEEQMPSANWACPRISPTRPLPPLQR